MSEFHGISSESEERLVIHMDTLSPIERADWVAAANRALALQDQRQDVSWDFMADVVKWLEFPSAQSGSGEKMQIYVEVARIISRN